MAGSVYKKIKSYKLSEIELREIWENEYCDKNNPIHTFDGILVKFYPEMFNHCFYESHNRQQGDKSILSLNRLEKMLWIKSTLQDSQALLKLGWDKKKKKYVKNRRISFVKGNYIVVINLLKGKKEARFVTAYEIQDEDNREKIYNSPNWEE